MPSLLSLVLISSLFLPSLVVSYRTGSPGVDYPNYLRAPRTSFECRGRGNGYFSDPEAGCQAYHVCDNGRKYSFVCPVTTLFSDSIKTCDYWYNVKCQNAARDHNEVDNERPAVNEPEAEETEPVSEPAPKRPVRPTPNPSGQQSGSGWGRLTPRPQRRPATTTTPLPSTEEPVTSQPEVQPEAEGSDHVEHHEDHPEHHEGEGDQNQPDVRPTDPMEGGSDIDISEWRRSGSATASSRPWTTYKPAAQAEPTTSAAPKWMTFESSTQRLDADSGAIEPRGAATTDSVTTPVPEEQSSTTTQQPENAEPENATGGEFRSENWMEQGMPPPSTTTESGNEVLDGEASSTPTATSADRDARGVRKRSQAQDATQDVGMIGSMMKWAAAASSALSLRQSEPNVRPTTAGENQFSSPKGPNPYVPYEQQERRAREQRMAQAAAVPRVTSPRPLPSPATESSLNPPYVFPYEPSVNASMATADSGMHVSLNERKVYSADRTGRGGAQAGRAAAAAPTETVDHPNPWTFPMTDQEASAAASEAARPRDTYRARRRDDPTDVSRRTKGAAETGSAFDMQMATSSSTNTKPDTAFVSGITERLPAESKPTASVEPKPRAAASAAAMGKGGGNFLTGEVMPNGQCRCPVPDSDVYFS